MAKTIEFTYDGVDYKLEFTRKTVETMEKQGFVLDHIDTAPMTTLPRLFAGAFLANHRFTKNAVIDEIYAQMPNEAHLISCLAEMYNEPINTLLDDEIAEGEGKNAIAWEPSF